MKIAEAATISIVLLLGFGMIGVVLALNPHEEGQTGQPGKTCCDEGAELAPGNSANSPGSPFNEAGSGTGGQHYNENSQYDVACYQVSHQSNGQTSSNCPSGDC